MISDDDLLLYYYRDGLSEAERARVGAALAEHPELAQRLHKLVTHLDAAAAMPELPVPESTRQRWRAALERAAQRQTTAAPVRQRSTPWQWLAAAAVLLAMVPIVQFTRHSLTPDTPQSTAYDRGLQTHLASTERQLASLESASPEEREKLVQSIIEQNRIYALAAERAGEPQLARVLRAFAPVLESVAHGGTDTSASVAQLAFELRVMQDRLAAGASRHPSTTL